jgi:DNA-directed RNA polymerase specialized sigma24 family protein
VLIAEETAALAVQCRGEAPPADPEDLTRLLSLLPPVQAAALSLFYVEELEYK